MDLDVKKIGAVLRRRRGGLDQATDAELLAIWDSLSPADRHDYLAAERVLATPDKKRRDTHAADL